MVCVAHVFRLFLLLLCVTVWSAGAEEVRLSRDEVVRAADHIQQVHVAYRERESHYINTVE